MNIICMIPARSGSQRLKYKNLALINNKALIEYTIENALKTKIFNKIFVNSDSSVFEYFCLKHKVSFYLRKKKLASSQTKSDDVVFDFILNNHLNQGLLVWLNPIAPLITPDLIKNVIDKFFSQKLSSAITSNNRKVHACIKSKPINYFENQKFSKTQDLIPINTFNYALMMWDIEKFKKNFIKNKHCFFIDKFKTIDIPEINSFFVKTDHDLKIIEKFMNFSKISNFEVKYHKQIKYLK